MSPTVPSSGSAFVLLRDSGSRLLASSDETDSAERPNGGADGGADKGMLEGTEAPGARRDGGGSMPGASPGSLGVLLFDLEVLILEELESRERDGGGQSFHPSIKSPR